MEGDPDVRRLHWGCGPRPAEGWINSDVRPAPGVDLQCDILEGLPLPDRSVDYAVAMHALSDLAFADVERALSELHRILKVGGVLRLGLPDLERAIAAYLRGDGGYFHVPDADARTVSGKLCVQATWYGSVKTPFTFDFARELLERGGFRSVIRCAYRATASPWPAIAGLDNRERESLYVEGTR